MKSRGSPPTASDQLETPESAYCASVDAEHRRRFGQVFTPTTVADQMARWALSGNPASLLDPAMGTGVFLRAANRVIESSSGAAQPTMTACEVDAAIADFAAMNTLTGDAPVNVIQADFLKQSFDREFDAIICNPPYVRHHDAEIQAETWRAFDELIGERISRMSNIYALFLIKIASLLSSRGRAAVITPTEYLNADFGVAVKRHLLSLPSFAGVIIFDFRLSVFADAMTTASIALFDAAADNRIIKLTHVSDSCEFASAFDVYEPSVENDSESLSTTQSVICVDRAELDPRTKWGVIAPVPYRGVASAHSITHSDDGDAFVPLSEIATCSRGIATGANDFFTLTESQVAELKLPREVLLPCICRAQDVPNDVFDQDAFDQLVAADRRVWLLSVTPETESLAAEYLRRGMDRNVHKRYLTRHRKPWYRSEERRPAPLWVTVFGRKRLRFVRNLAGVMTLTAFHVIYPNERCAVDADALAQYFDTPAFRDHCLTQIRVYGDGLMKFEPRDVLRLQVPATFARSQ